MIAFAADELNKDDIDTITGNMAQLPVKGAATNTVTPPVIATKAENYTNVSATWTAGVYDGSFLMVESAVYSITLQAIGDRTFEGGNIDESAFTTDMFNNSKSVTTDVTGASGTGTSSEIIIRITYDLQDIVINITDLGAETKISSTPVKGALLNSITALPSIAPVAGVYSIKGSDWAEESKSGSNFLATGNAIYEIVLEAEENYTFADTNIVAQANNLDFGTASVAASIQSANAELKITITYTLSDQIIMLEDVIAEFENDYLGTLVRGGTVGTVPSITEGDSFTSSGNWTDGVTVPGTFDKQDTATFTITLTKKEHFTFLDTDIEAESFEDQFELAESVVASGFDGDNPIEIAITYNLAKIDVALLTAVPDGDASSVTTTEIVLTFDKDVLEDIDESNIDITGDAANDVNILAVTGSDSSRTVEISGTWEEGDEINIGIKDLDDYNITPAREVTLHRGTEPRATATGILTFVRGVLIEEVNTSHQLVVTLEYETLASDANLGSVSNVLSWFDGSLPAGITTVKAAGENLGNTITFTFSGTATNDIVESMEMRIKIPESYLTTTNSDTLDVVGNITSKVTQGSLKFELESEGEMTYKLGGDDNILDDIGINTSGNKTIDLNGFKLILSGAITGTGTNTLTIINTGPPSGLLTLSGTNSFSNPLIIDDGARVNIAHTTNSGVIDVVDGTLYLTAENFTLGANIDVQSDGRAVFEKEGVIVGNHKITNGGILDFNYDVTINGTGEIENNKTFNALSLEITASTLKNNTTGIIKLNDNFVLDNLPSFTNDGLIYTFNNFNDNNGVDELKLLNSYDEGDVWAIMIEPLSTTHFDLRKLMNDSNDAWLDAIKPAISGRTFLTFNGWVWDAGEEEYIETNMLDCDDKHNYEIAGGSLSAQWQTTGGGGTTTTPPQTGWRLDENGNWIHLDENGNPRTGWHLDADGHWYYLGTGVIHANSWVMHDGTWYHVGASGSMSTNRWVAHGDDWYYLAGNGMMATNTWVWHPTGWHYLGSNGAMVTNTWVQHGSDWYYIGADGVMVVSTTINGYVVDATGRWIP
jgi:hypothetical protein